MKIGGKRGGDRSLKPMQTLLGIENKCVDSRPPHLETDPE